MKTASVESSQKPHVSEAALRWSIATATVLMAIKVIAALLTNSMAIMASALDSLLDMASSSVNFFASRKAAKPPDSNHEYGHEKIESLASLFQSLFILSSGFFLVIEAGKRFFSGTLVKDPGSGIAVMAFSILLTFLLTLKLRSAQRQTDSLILKTEILHYAMDLLSNVGTIVALFLVFFTKNAVWDLAFSILIAIYVLRTAVGIFWQAVNELLDRSLPEVSKEEIGLIIMETSPKIVNFHNFRSRKVGQKIFLDFHIEIRDESDFKRAHDLTEMIIARIQKKYPDADITVHYDPEGAK